jgi:HAD superfamily hydrolase (TIGR01450 family)
MSDAVLVGVERPLVEVYDLALLDLDGVVYIGPDAVPHAADALARAREAGMALRFVTNNASRPAGTVADHLAELGIPATEEEVVTSAMAAAAMLARRVPPGSPVLVVGGEGLYWALRREGLRPVGSMDDAPVAVVQGFSPDLGWRLLAEGTRAVRSGLPWIATNTDLTVPTPHGPAPGNGTLVHAVRVASGVEPEVAGKPQPALFRTAVERSGASRPLVVGDRLDTDLEGARAADVPGLLVLTGVCTASQVILAAPHERPSMIGADLRSLFDPHPEPARGSGADGGWTCRAASVCVQDGELRVDGAGEDPVDLLRAACAAAWEAHDTGAGDVTPAPVLAALAAMPDAESWAR